MYKLLIKVLFFLLLIGTQLQAQVGKNSKINAINNYIRFSNESTHGMLVISRLLENFNKKVNNYIDTGDKEFSNYSNGDLPKDIFRDSDRWFYEISPAELYDIAKKEGTILSTTQELNSIITKMKAITSETNQFRFRIEEFVNFINYKDPVFLEELYAMLEEAVGFFNSFYAQQLKLEKLINDQQIAENSKYGEFFDSYNKVYRNLRSVLNDLRVKDKRAAFSDIKIYKNNVQDFNNKFGNSYFSNSRSKRRLKSIKEKSQAILNSMENYLNNVPMPDDYKQYGMDYYYHNADILNKTNKYGNGMVSELNKIIFKEELSKIMFFEIPHFYKVITKKLTWKKRDYRKKKKRRK